MIFWRPTKHNEIQFSDPNTNFMYTKKRFWCNKGPKIQKSVATRLVRNTTINEFKRCTLAIGHCTVTYTNWFYHYLRNRPLKSNQCRSKYNWQTPITSSYSIALFADPLRLNSSPTIFGLIWQNSTFSYFVHLQYY